MWFQQDVSTAQTARSTTDILTETCPGRLISRFCYLHWQADHPFLFRMSRVHGLEALKENIRQQCEVQERVMENSIKQARHQLWRWPLGGGGHVDKSE